MLKSSIYDVVTRFDLARTIAGRGRYWTTAYLLDGLLVDSGCAFSAQELVQVLEDVPLTHIVITHTHEDHIGANGRLQHQRENLDILAHPLAIPVLANPRRQQPLHPYRRLLWGWPEPSRARPLVDEAWHIETKNFRLQVIYTPGHSADHVCLYVPERGWLFTGDLIGDARTASQAQHHPALRSTIFLIMMVPTTNIHTAKLIPPVQLKVFEQPIIRAVKLFLGLFTKFKLTH